MGPSARAMIGASILLAVAWSCAFLFSPGFFETCQWKLTDPIATYASQPAPSDGVVVIELDDRSLDARGQWPWPRSLVADLLKKIAGLGARSIALDFILAEADRFSPTPSSSSSSPSGGSITENDAALADVLSQGPFILGYEFFSKERGLNGSDCRFRPAEIFHVRSPREWSGSVRIYEARDVLCNLPEFSEAAPHSGFLNGSPDPDGIFRRLPLLIRYHGEAYPSLALVALLADNERKHNLVLKQRRGGRSHLMFGLHAIPIDDNAEMRIRFPEKGSQLTHISAERILNGEVEKSEIQGRIVLVGLGASGLATMYRTPCGGAFTALEMHAQAVESVLSESYILRDRGSAHIEVFLALAAAALVGLGVARLGFWTNAAAWAAVVVAMWGGSQTLFESSQVLLSPFFPAATVVVDGLVLMVFKYWVRQRHAYKRLQETLVLVRNNQQKLDSIIKTIPDIVFRLDASGRITFISPALSKYAKNPESLIGKPIIDLVSPEDREKAHYHINERRTGLRATSDLELRLTLAADDDSKEGADRFFSISAEGIYSKSPPDSQSFLGTQGIARDIHQRKRLEHELERSRKMEAMGRLAAGIAHDLNNILSGLVSYPELLLLDIPEGDPMRAKIQTIQRAGQRAADIVQDLLMISRRSVKKHAPIQLNDVVKGYLESPEFKRLEKCNPCIHFETDLDQGLLKIKGSAVHMSKALMNLVGNATEAMPAGGNIVVGTRNQYLDDVIEGYERIPEGEYVLLSVADDGVGIPADALHRIFEPFYSKKRLGHSGSGLGMTVVWNTVKDHDGFLNIHSQEGRGSRFEIYLPATRMEEAPKTEADAVLEDYTGTERILVVDDVPEQREIATSMLKRLGYQVSAVHSGESALSFLKKQEIDLVLLDMVMHPGIDGLDTYRGILLIRPGQKAVIASGYAANERVQAMQDLGAGEYIRKPYTLEKIGLAIRRELDRKQPER